MADATFYGARPGGYHFTNVLLHCANVLLVFSALESPDGRPACGVAFVAGLFAVHPLHVESVAWIAERKDVLSLFFGLLSLNAYVAYAQRGRFSAISLRDVVRVQPALEANAGHAAVRFLAPRLVSAGPHPR